MTEKWEEPTGEGVPCPVAFDAQDLGETTALNEELSTAERGFDILQSMCGIGEEGWVLVEDYEDAVEFLKEIKEEALAEAESEEERGEIMTRWPWDDMDEMTSMVMNRARRSVLVYLSTTCIDRRSPSPPTHISRVSGVYLHYTRE